MQAMGGLVNDHDADCDFRAVCDKARGGEFKKNRCKLIGESYNYKQKSPPKKVGFIILVAEAGFEPTTFGL